MHNGIDIPREYIHTLWLILNPKKRHGYFKKR